MDGIEEAFSLALAGLNGKDQNEFYSMKNFLNLFEIYLELRKILYSDWFEFTRNNVSMGY